MKVNKTISIDHELSLMIKEKHLNLSQFVNKCLHEEINKSTIREVVVNETKLNAQLRELEAKKNAIEKATTKQALIDDLKIPDKLKQHLVSLERRPNILALGEFLRLHEIEKKYGVMDCVGLWEKIHA